MRTFHFSPRWLFYSTVAAFSLLGNNQPVTAQGHTPDPYNIVGEYNSQYEPYLYATEPTEDGTLPNQNIRDPRSARSRSSSESINGLDDLEGNSLEPAEPSTSRRRAGAGTPYYRAALDEDRTGRTNQQADDSYFANQRKRSEEYFKAMSVKDPKKRARMLRELNLENIRVSRMLPNFKTSTSAKRGERLTFDSPSDEIDDANVSGRQREEEIEENPNARKRPSTETLRPTPSRSRAGSNPKTKRSSPARGASRTPSPSRDRGSPSTPFWNEASVSTSTRNRRGTNHPETPPGGFPRRSPDSARLFPLRKRCRERAIVRYLFSGSWDSPLAILARPRIIFFVTTIAAI